MVLISYGQIWEIQYEEIYLHIGCRENASSAMMLSFKPVVVDLPVDVNNVSFLQWQLPAKRKHINGNSIRLQDSQVQNIPNIHHEDNINFCLQGTKSNIGIRLSFLSEV